MSSVQFAVCIKNDGYPAALEPRKLYRVIPDSQASKHHQVRVVDESGEDYLYPDSFFLEVPLSEQVAEQVVRVG